MIERLLPDVVAAVDTCHDPPDATLYPEEEALLERAVDKRRREFRTVRHCARTAMRALGIAPAPVLPGPAREPRWPEGVVGSMTHCAGYRAAALARGTDVHSIGIDAEPHEPLPDGVLEVVTGDEERSGLAELGGTPCWDRILFCAKESVYKAWYPLAGRWLGFEDATVTVTPHHPLPGTAAAGTFRARLLVPGPVVGGSALTRFDGRWLVSDGSPSGTGGPAGTGGLVITAITLLTGR